MDKLWKYKRFRLNMMGNGLRIFLGINYHFLHSPKSNEE
jgi:hypothetical protein